LSTQKGSALTQIVTLTMNPAIDKSTTVDSVVPERKLRCGSPRFDPGGGGINVSRAIKKLGGESVAIYPSGGLPGRMLERLLDAEGLSHVPLAHEGFTRENLHVEETSTGQQFRFNMPGCEMSREEWTACLEAVRGIQPAPEYLVLSGSLPPGVPDDFWARAVRLGNELGAKVIVDTSGPSLSSVTSERPYLLKPNLRELEQLVPGATGHEEDIAGAALGLVEQQLCEVLVVSLAAAGALLVTRDHVETLCAPTVRAVSKVGAGDSMVGGMVLSLARGRSIRDAVRYGLAAGTAAVMRHGTQLCRLEDADRLFARTSRGTDS
jgi:6-phosphofructokinase 2